MIKLSINPQLENAIKQAVKDVNQKPTLANRLIAWIDAMSHRELSKDEMHQFLDTSRNAIQSLEFEDTDEN